MRLLYAVFVVSIAALLWAAYAVAQTVRKHRREEAGSATLNLQPRPANIETENETRVATRDDP